MSTPDTTHGACGKSWHQRGNTTGHCGGCHETFEGLTIFDAHQRLSETGSVICADPASMVFRGEPLRLIDGTWRGPARPADTIPRSGPPTCPLCGREAETDDETELHICWGAA